MKMIDMSVICVYNNEQCLQDHLLFSLKKQNVECEIILLDNRKNIYTSASCALNIGIKKATKSFVLIVHQDIHFTSFDVIEKIYAYLVMHENNIIGSAGVKIDSHGIISSMQHGLEKANAGEICIEEREQVDVLDECMVAGRKFIFETNPFDEIICDGWDLYVVDFCLQVNPSYSVYVLPLDIWHVSPGNPTRSFYACARKLFKKHRHKVKNIRTCCITISVSTKWYSSFILSLLEVRCLLRK